MKIRKMISVLFVLVLSITCTSCDKMEEEKKNIEPQVSQMKSISELAAMECYYHNVAKFKEEDAEGILLWKKDKNFWIEYSGVVKIGIDATLLNIVVEEDKVTISIPEAKVLGKKVDEASLNKDSFIVDIDSADISGDDEVKAFAEAQEYMVKAAAEDSALLASAQQRVQKLLEEYVTNIGNAVGKEYSIEWKYIDTEENDSVETNGATDTAVSEETVVEE